MNLKTVIFMGRSGSGKGTQAELLYTDLLKNGVKKKDILNVRTGDLFRAFAKKKGFTQNKVQTTLNTGIRQPEFLAISLWGNYFIKKYRPNSHLFLDGFPRLLAEAIILENALRFYERKPIDIVNIEVSDKWATERLLARGRNDDTPVGIKKRLEFYKKDVVPAIDHFRASPHVCFHEINGERTIEDVHKEIVEKVLR